MPNRRVSRLANFAPMLSSAASLRVQIRQRTCTACHFRFDLGRGPPSTLRLPCWPCDSDCRAACLQQLLRRGLQGQVLALNLGLQASRAKAFRLIASLDTRRCFASTQTPRPGRRHLRSGVTVAIGRRRRNRIRSSIGNLAADVRDTGAKPLPAFCAGALRHARLDRRLRHS